MQEFSHVMSFIQLVAFQCVFLLLVKVQVKKTLKTRALDCRISVLTMWGQKHWLERGADISTF